MGMREEVFAVELACEGLPSFPVGFVHNERYVVQIMIEANRFDPMIVGEQAMHVISLARAAGDRGEGECPAQTLSAMFGQYTQHVDVAVTGIVEFAPGEDGAHDAPFVLEVKHPSRRKSGILQDDGAYADGATGAKSAFRIDCGELRLVAPSKIAQQIAIG